uniref:Uncharacterized protein n=1 Tax=Arundo donax TaxID=35708 RepID=A0A0A9ADF9_ARUDO
MVRCMASVSQCGTAGLGLVVGQVVHDHGEQSGDHDDKEAMAAATTKTTTTPAEDVSSTASYRAPAMACEEVASHAAEAESRAPPSAPTPTATQWDNEEAILHL